MPKASSHTHRHLYTWRNWTSLPWSQETSSRRFIDENLMGDGGGESFLCPADLKHSHLLQKYPNFHDPNTLDDFSTGTAAGVNQKKNDKKRDKNKKSNEHSASSSEGDGDDEKQSSASFTVGGILIFPGAILTKYFAAIGLVTDWKHYGFPLHTVFLRSMQGIVQEYMTQRDFRIHSRSNKHHKKFNSELFDSTVHY